MNETNQNRMWNAINWGVSVTAVTIIVAIAGCNHRTRLMLEAGYEEFEYPQYSRSTYWRKAAGSTNQIPAAPLPEGSR